jgi:hypothetical protein
LRFWTRAATALLLSLSGAGAWAQNAAVLEPAAIPAPPVAAAPAADEGLEDLEHRTFQFFWATVNPTNGLVPDRYPTRSFASVAAVGFALTAYPIGVERGYVSRADALERVTVTLRFFHDAPQGTSTRGVTGYKGFFYHFLDMSTGFRYSSEVELSTIDTALFLAGVLFCESYFDRPDAKEAEVRRLAEDIYRRVDWAWAMRGHSGVALGWTPENGFHPLVWRGYDEAMIIYLLGLGSPTLALPADAWQAWTGSYGPHWLTQYGQTYLAFPPLFGHLFSHIWVDFHGIRDAFMRDKGIDYFENTRRAVYAQRAYAIANPLHWRGYGSEVWGLSACDGPGNRRLPFEGGMRVFHGYSARGVGVSGFDDGTLTPNAVAGSLPFAPELALPALREMQQQYGDYIYSTYGFLDSFNPTFDYDVRPDRGRRIAGVGWVDSDYLGIDEGLIVAMIENYRSGLVWRVMRTNPYLRRGLERAGFEGGWLDRPP